MLNGYRVLDLSNERGIFCGYMLAQLGAEVVAVEPPGGSSVRQLAPMFNDKGLWWEAYARGKQSLELDISSPAGKQQFDALVKDVDFVIESYSPEQAASLGLTFAELHAINPGLILVSITPFGQTGPKANWPATDLTLWAASGAHALAGDVDLAPVRTSVPQSYLHAGGDAAGAALVALQARHSTGKGQQVDISVQQSCAQAALSAFLGPQNQSEMVIRREAGGLSGDFPVKMTWPCKNGYVAITLLFGPAFTEPNRRLLRWVAEEGYCSAEAAEEDWGIKIAMMVVAGESPEPYFELCKNIEAFTMQHTREELFEEGLDRGIYIAPTLDISGLMEERHFHSRNYWHSFQIGDKTVRGPGQFAQSSAAPTTPGDAAPELNSFSNFSGNRPEAPEGKDAPDLPLKGLKVLDFMWVIAGPLFTRTLADCGATVVKVESSSRLDPVRASPPFVADEQSVNHGAPFHNFNAGKKGITIDPSNPVGKEVLVELVKWADVVTESFSPKAMKAWGLDYDSLKAINPDIIMVSSCLMGQTGDRAQVPGYGNMAAAITGFYELTGWADRSPAGPYLAYTDGVSPRFMLATTMAALEHRRRTGEGQHIDLSQAEAAIHLLAPAILDYELNGNIWQRMGNEDLGMCPHGVYPVEGDDQWIAIACENDQAWRKLLEVSGLQQLATFDSTEARKANEETINNALGAWTATQPAQALTQTLIAKGIAAHPVQNAVECVNDPQFTSRSHFIQVPQASVGTVTIENNKLGLTGTPTSVKKAGPDLGEYNVEVLMEVLGYDADKMADVFASLAME